MKINHLTTSCAMAVLLVAATLTCTSNSAFARGSTSTGTFVEPNDARHTGTDDAVNHDANDDNGALRNGADDAPGHNLNDNRGRGRGRGADASRNRSRRGR